MDVLWGNGTPASKTNALGRWSDIFGLRKFSSHSRCELRWSLQNLQLLTIQVQIFSRIMSSRFFIYNVNLHEHFSQTNDANIPRNKNQYLRSWRKCSQCLSSMHRLCSIIIIFLFPLHWDFFTSRDITFVIIDATLDRPHLQPTLNDLVMPLMSPISTLQDDSN